MFGQKWDDLPAGLAAKAFIIATGAPWVVLLVTLVVLGVGTSMIGTPAARLLRRVSTDQTRSYIFTAQFSLSHACFIITYPVAGWAGAVLGQSAAAAILAVLAAISAIVAVRLWPAASRRFQTVSQQ